MIVALCAGFVAVVSAQSGEDEAAVRASAKRILDTFNAHDAKANAALDDETYENWDGSVKGPAEDEKGARELFERQKDLQRTMLEEIGIVQVTADVAIYKFRGEWTGGIDEDGNARPRAEFLHAMVLVKRDGEWRLAAGFNRITPE